MILVSFSPTFVCTVGTLRANLPIFTAFLGGIHKETEQTYIDRSNLPSKLFVLVQCVRITMKKFQDCYFWFWVTIQVDRKTLTTPSLTNIYYKKQAIYTNFRAYLMVKKSTYVH